LFAVPEFNGVRVLLIGLGEDVYELELPYPSLPELREPIMPADLVKQEAGFAQLHRPGLAIREA
jgi:hypothetical protein